MSLPAENSADRRRESSRLRVGEKELRRGSDSWVARIAAGLTPRRIRAHAFILAVCLWGVCAFDYATPGLFDRAGNLKFQDFLPLYISARMVSQHHAVQLYESNIFAAEEQGIANQPSLRLPLLYGPQVGLCFVPLTRLPFFSAAEVWAGFSVLIYFVCVYFCWRACSAFRANWGTVILCAVAYPPLYHSFVRGQLSAVCLLCFTAAFFALRAKRLLLAGVFMGLLVFKPQFLVAIPLVLLLARAWKVVFGLVLGSIGELIFARLYFGAEVLRRYLEMLRNAPDWVHTAELSLAPIQMHSLRAFWTLLIPWSGVVWTLYILSSIGVIAVAAMIWKSKACLELRFSALMISAVLVDPHIFIYDLLVLAPMFLLLANWSTQRTSDSHAAPMSILLYLAFLVPLFGPISRWTHVQLSVLIFVGLLWTLSRIANDSSTLATPEPSVV